MYKEEKAKFKIVLNFFGRIISIFLIATISIVLYDIYGNINVESKQISEIEENTNPEEIDIKKEEIYETIEEVSNAVVGISKLQSIDVTFFTLEAAKTYNLGTGIIIAKEGYVITNNHITGNLFSKCYITLKDGEEYTGNVIWTDEYLDLSIIKVNTTREMSNATLGNSDDIKVGQTVYAIGNPL